MPKLLEDVDGALERVRRLGVQGSDQLPERLTDEEKQQTADAVERLDVEIYTGADDRILRRLVVDLGLQAPEGEAQAGAQSVDISFDLQLLDVNEDQDIEAPSGAKPFDELVAQLEGLGLGNLGLGGGGSGGAAAAAARTRRTSSATRSASRRPRATATRSASARICLRLRSEGIIPPVSQARAPFNLRRFLLSGEGWPYLLVPFIPIAIVLELVHASATIIFVTSALGVIPTAALMGRATEELAARSGPGIGGFLNVTFGNAPELIIAFFALNEGLQEVVKASLVGSILGNILLVMGAAMLVGGRKRERQFFDRTAANTQSLMLLLAAVALVMPAIYELVIGGSLPSPTDESKQFPSELEQMSFAVAIILLASYAAGLLFSLRTHRNLFNPSHEEEDHGGEPWSVRRAVISLAIAGVAVGVMSEILVGSISEASEAIGLSPFFVGIIVVAIVGNAAEHWVAIYFAARDKMDLSVNIAIGSSAQIALFAAPVLVLLSFVVGPFPMALVFNGLELGAIFMAILIANQVTQEGESTWFEGLQLLAVYVVLGLVFFFVE